MIRRTLYSESSRSTDSYLWNWSQYFTSSYLSNHAWVQNFSGSLWKSFIHWMTTWVLTAMNWLKHVTTNLHKSSCTSKKIKERQKKWTNTFILNLSYSCNINACKCRGGENDKRKSADLLMMSTVPYFCMLSDLNTTHLNSTQWFNQMHPRRGIRKLSQSYLGDAVQEITKKEARKTEELHHFSL